MAEVYFYRYLLRNNDTCFPHNLQPVRFLSSNKDIMLHLLGLLFFCDTFYSGRL